MTENTSTLNHNLRTLITELQLHRKSQERLTEAIERLNDRLDQIRAPLYPDVNADRLQPDTPKEAKIMRGNREG